MTVPRDQLALSTQCGLASAGPGNGRSPVRGRPIFRLPAKHDNSRSGMGPCRVPHVPHASCGTVGGGQLDYRVMQVFFDLPAVQTAPHDRRLRQHGFVVTRSLTGRRIE